MKLFKALLIIALSLPICVYSENPKKEAEEEVKKAFEEAENEINQESIKAEKEIDQAAKEADKEISQAAAESTGADSGKNNLDETIAEVKQAVGEAMQEAHDAVKEMKAEATESVAEAREEAHEALKECTDKEDHKGGGGALTISLLRFDSDPVADLASTEADLKGKLFDFDKRTMAAIGGIGYYDVGNGARLGVSGQVGYKQYVSDIFTTIDTNGTPLDSQAILRIWPAHIGFHFEKAFIFSKVTLFLGGLFGGGADIVYKKFEDRTNPSAFIDMQSDSTHDTRDEFGSIGFASFVAWDIHGGVGFRLAPVFEVGIEPYVLFNYAPEGFGTGFGDFFATTPGLRLRFTFGKQA